MQVVFDFANKKVVVDGDGPDLVNIFSLIKEIAPKLPSITFTSTGSVDSSSGGNGGGGNGSGGGEGGGNSQTGHNQTMRQFVRSLSLGSLSEKITAIAYYQSKVLSRPTFSPKDMADWFTQCGLEKPTQMSVAVFDTKKRNGFIENAGHGSWKVSTQGENFIIRKTEESKESKA